MPNRDTFVQRVRILSGVGCLAEIGQIVEELGYHKALLVYDKGIGSTGIPQKIAAYLQASNIDSVSFDKVESDPPAEVVDEGAILCKQEGCDCVIGIGGGSAIDTAKGINLLRFNPGAILDYAGVLDYAPCHGMIAVPTTAGTGSEMSDGAIITDRKQNRKVPIVCVHNMCDYAILDAELTVGLPRSLTLLTGLDAFTHVAEGYTSRRASAMTDIVCEAVMQTIVENLPKVLMNGKDLEAREKMQASSSMAGWMLYTCSAHVGHSVAHVLGGSQHLVHGAACAYALPGVLKLVSPILPQKVKKIGEILGISFDNREDPAVIGQLTADAFTAFCHTLGLSPVEKLELSPAELEDLADQVVHEPLAGNTPKSVTKEDALALLKEALVLQ